MEKLAWLLDGAIPVPGTRFRFGLDSIIGLIPGVGDVIGFGIGAMILYQSVRIGVPRSVLGKMLGNAALDALGGLVPGIGDLFDFAFKSNRRNVKLLTEHLDSVEGRPETQARGSRLLALLLVLGLLAAGGGLLWWIWRFWFGAH